MGVVQHLVVRDDLSGMRRHSSHAARKAGRNASFYFVVRRVVLDRGDQDFPFVLIRIALIGGNPLWRAGELLIVIDGGRSTAVARSSGDGRTLGAMDVA